MVIQPNDMQDIQQLSFIFMQTLHPVSYTHLKIKVFRHMDMAHLEELLQEPVEGKRLIITDGVFSMDGDLAPLPKMADLADQYNALLVVDDAHGDGVMGPAGRGTVDHFGLRDRIIIETGSQMCIRDRLE